jgi:hypothetical protein
MAENVAKRAGSGQPPISEFAYRTVIRPALTAERSQWMPECPARPQAVKAS